MAAAIVRLSLIAAEDRAKRQAGRQSSASAVMVVATAPATIAAAPAAVETTTSVAAPTTPIAAAVTAAALMAASAMAAAASVLRKPVGGRHRGADEGERSYGGRQTPPNHGRLLLVVKETRGTAG
jgi:hypothetical protein